jgi:hypothetical protein
MAYLTLSFSTYLAVTGTEISVQSAEAPKWLMIEGLVENKLNLTYAELRSFPMISEVTMLQCVGGGQGGMKVTYNWTGVPLFYLLSMAKVVPGAYRKVVFNSTDGFSDSIVLQTAMEPTTLLGLRANGTDLEQVTGFGSGYRIVLPCRWGYKWVKWVKQIIVVDYNYEGEYERLGLSDEALRPNCSMPNTSPPIQNFTATRLQDYVIRALSNSSIDAFSFKSEGRLIFRISGQEGSRGFFYVMLPRELFSSPYQILIDEQLVPFDQTFTDGEACVYFNYSHSNHTIEIGGSLPASNGGAGGLLQERQLK